MADAYLIKQGAAGSGSDECTANRKHVLAPYTAITGDSGDDPTTGTMVDQSGWKKTLAAGESVMVPGGYHDGKGTVMAKDLASQTGGTAADSDIRKGKTAVVNGKTITGTQEDRGAWSSTGLLAGQSVTIPAGIHNGSGKIIAASLASQTAGATVKPEEVPKGKTYWANGVLETGKGETQSAISFSAAALSHNTIRISWKNPTSWPWEGIFIQMSTSGTPGASGGTRVYTGAGNNPHEKGGSNYVDITGLEPVTKYYFSCVNFYTGWPNGTQVNIDATTTHVYLYNRGTNFAEIALSDEYVHSGTTYVGTESIVYGTKLSSGTFVTKGKWDLSQYSKVIVKFKATDAQYGHNYNFYFSMFAKPNSTFTSVASGGVAWTGEEQTLEMSIKQKTNDILYFGARNSNSLNGTSGGIQAEIYEIWLE